MAHRSRRRLQPLVWLAAGVLLVAGGVFTLRVGVDVLYVGSCLLILVALDRVIGDRLAESLGSGPASVILGIAVVGFSWYAIAASDEFFAAAEKRGYTSIYRESKAPSPDPPANAAATESRAPELAETRIATSSAAPPTRSIDAAEASSPSGRARPEAEAAKEQPAISATAGTITGSSLFFGEREPPGPLVATSIVLTIVPAQVLPARRARLECAVLAQGRPVSGGSVDFVVNGVLIARERVGADGRASATFATAITGEYEVRAHFSGTASHQPSSSSAGRLRVSQGS
jgi:hypothetical protein